jgi:TrmH family RNA methyltransferase
MVAKSEIKDIRRLHQKKYRLRERRFLAEGIKVVDELLASDIRCHRLYSTDPEHYPEAVPASAAELKKMSALVQPNTVLGVFEIPGPQPPTFQGWTLALDGVRDPGNLGTLIRLCDWFGISELLCSPDTVDCYNPKVLQASMGSLARVRLHYEALEPLLAGSGLMVYGASMEGRPAAAAPFPAKGVLVMGSESHGISPELRELLSATVSIPAKGGAESLNVAMAAGILLYEISRAEAAGGISKPGS